jgi:16S rRNA G1207 methylase RsmC
LRNYYQERDKNKLRSHYYKCSEICRKKLKLLTLKSMWIVQSLPWIHFHLFLNKGDKRLWLRRTQIADLRIRHKMRPQIIILKLPNQVHKKIRHRKRISKNNKLTSRLKMLLLMINSSKQVRNNNKNKLRGYQYLTQLEIKHLR